MKRARFSEEHILEILRKAELEGDDRAVCQRENITEHTLQRWKGAYRGKLIDTAPDRGPSRSQRTRDANAINQIGIQLVGMSAEALDRLELPDELREAIDLCKTLKKSGRGRQQRRVGKLLRAEEDEALLTRLEGI